MQREKPRATQRCDGCEDGKRHGPIAIHRRLGIALPDNADAIALIADALAPTRHAFRFRRQIGNAPLILLRAQPKRAWQIEQGQPGFDALDSARRATGARINPLQHGGEQFHHSRVKHRMHAHTARAQHGQEARKLDGIAKPLFAHHQQRFRQRATTPHRHGFRAIRARAGDLGEDLRHQIKAHFVSVPGFLPKPSAK